MPKDSFQEITRPPQDKNYMLSITFMVYILRPFLFAIISTGSHPCFPYPSQICWSYLFFKKKHKNRNCIHLSLEQLAKISFSKWNWKTTYWSPICCLGTRFSRVHHCNNQKTWSFSYSRTKVDKGLESWQWRHLASSESEAIVQSINKYLILKSLLVLLDPGSPEANDKKE